MGNVIPNGFGEATISFEFFNGPSNPMAIVFGYINDGDQAPNLNAAFIRDSYNQHVMSSGEIASNAQVVDVNVRQNPGGATGSAASAFFGTLEVPTLPPNITYLIRKHTAAGGRSGRGRIYQPGVATTLVSEGGVLTGGAITGLDAAFEAWNTDLGSVSIEMYLLHAAPSALAPFAVTGFSVDSLIATQRRRLR